jgi:hypothetical protein
VKPKINSVEVHPQLSNTKHHPSIQWMVHWWVLVHCDPVLYGFIKINWNWFQFQFFNYLKMTPPVMLGGSSIFFNKKLRFRFQFPFPEDDTSCGGRFFSFVRSKDASVEA